MLNTFSVCMYCMYIRTHFRQMQRKAHQKLLPWRWRDGKWRGRSTRGSNNRWLFQLSQGVWLNKKKILFFVKSKKQQLDTVDHTFCFFCCELCHVLHSFTWFQIFRWFWVDHLSRNEMRNTQTFLINSTQHNKLPRKECVDSLMDGMRAN